MSTTIKHVRMAPKGAKPTNPKYTLTLTRDQLLALRLLLDGLHNVERYLEKNLDLNFDIMNEDDIGRAALKVFGKVKDLSRDLV